LNLNIGGLAFLIPVVFVVVLAWFVVQGATIALMLTGMDRNKASFEALSAFFGVGFTTRTSEQIVAHPQRRRIISLLIVLGNAGIITVIVSLVGTFAKSSLVSVPIGLLIAVGLVFIIWRIAVSRGWTDKFEKWIEHKLLEAKVFKERRLLEMIEVDGEFVVGKVLTRKGCGFEDKQLKDLNLTHKGIIVLSINRSGRIIRPPKAENFIRKGDILTVFGKRKQIEKTF